MRIKKMKFTFSWSYKFQKSLRITILSHLCLFSALDGLNLDFPPLNSNNSNNYSSVSEVVAAAIMATSTEDTLPTSATATSTQQPHQPQNFSSSGSFTTVQKPSFIDLIMITGKNSNFRVFS